jgi:hypothetical protein
MKNILRVTLIALCLSSLTVLATGDQGGRGVVPTAGFVPDETTAIRIAEAVLIPIYGQKQVEAERPFSAKLAKDVWKVEGYLPPGLDGGVAEVSVAKRDGRILRVYHGL